MVQPALPLIRGFNSQQARTVAVEPEPTLVDSEPAAQALSPNGHTVADADTESDPEVLSSDATRTDSPAIGEVVIATG